MISKFTFFFHFSHDMSYISPFFLMSNEIILFQVLYRPLKYLLFSLMKMKILKFSQCEPCSINGPKFSKFWLFETFYIIIGHLVLVTFIHLYTLTHKVYVVKILGQKKLFRHSLWIFNLFLFMKQSLGFFSNIW